MVNRSDLLGLLDWRGYFRGEQGWLPGDQSGIRKNLDQAKAYGKGFLEGLSHEARTDYWADRINDHYDRNEILSANCQEMEVFRGRTDIADQEIARFVQDNREKGVTKIDQDKNIFHQPSEDSNCTNGDHSKFRNHKWVYGLLYGQNNDSVIFRPCEFILRKNGCWKNDCTFEDYGTWSWDTDPYTYGTNNYGGGNISHTIYDIVPWMLLGSTREQTNWNDFGDRLRTLF